MSSLRHGGDSRGGSPARRARKLRMLTTYGNGQTVACVWCGADLDFATLTVDRIIPGALGGSYRWENVQPSCLPDNQARGDKPAAEWSPAS